MPNIKFRVWDKEEKILRVLNDSHDSFIFHNDGHIDYYNLQNGSGGDEYIIMPFTGLYDDTGKEIYKGDLVEIQHKKETKTSYISQVTMTYNGVLVEKHPVHVAIGVGGNRLLSDYCDYGNGGIYNVTCKIVGNIYENPELLNKSKSI